MTQGKASLQRSRKKERRSPRVSPCARGVGCNGRIPACWLKVLCPESLLLAPECIFCRGMAGLLQCVQLWSEICSPFASGCCFSVADLLSLCFSSAEWLKPVAAYVLQAGIGQARAEIFHKQIVQNGGYVHSRLCSAVTHVIVAEDMDCDRAFRLLKLAKLPSRLQLVKASWLSDCIRDQKLLNTAGYSVFIPRR